MKYPIRLVFITVLLASLLAVVPAYSNDIPLLEPFTKNDRILVLAPHPDDEDIGCGGVIQRALKAGAKVKVLYLTCGDNNIFSIVFYSKPLFLFKLLFLKNKDFVDLGHRRVHEAIDAMKILGMNEKDLIFLGYPDHGTSQMFIYNWNHERPYRSTFSGHSNVPYKESLGYKKEFTADNVIEDVKNVILSYKPNKVFVSSSSDVNGDHWAYYLYMMIALVDLGKQIPDVKIYPYLVHAPGWPLPRHYHPDLEIEPPSRFFGEVYPLIGWKKLELTKEEIDKKYEAMKAYDSQMRVSSFYLASFVRKNEVFGDFPEIILKKQHSGLLKGREPYYDSDIQWFGYAIVDDQLWVKIKKPRELKHRLSFFFAIFGYREDLPFAKMPNILVKVRYNHFNIYNATIGKYIDVPGASVELAPESVIFKIPLSALGNPQGFLFGLESQAYYLPSGSTAFRVIDIE